MQGGEAITHFTDSVGTTSTVYTYPNNQEGLTVRNDGNSAVTLTVNGTNYTMQPGLSQTVGAVFTSFAIGSVSGNQQFSASAWSYQKDVVTFEQNIAPIADSRQLMVRTTEPEKLSIPTYEGSGQCVHPSVVYIPLGFNGYKYWMAYTPYPNGNDDYENPSIVASNDGTRWVVPDGLTNPIVPAPVDVGTGGYNSDPYLIYDGTQLIIYYRYVTAGGVRSMRRTTSANGIAWAATSSCTFATDVGNANIQPTTADPLSMSVIRVSASIWFCFFTVGNKVYRSSSSDGIAFAHPKQVVHNMPQSCNMWHMDVYYDESGYHSVIAAFAANKSNLDNQLYYGYSADGLFWIFDLSPVLQPNYDSDWYSRQIYKSSMTPHPNGKGYRVYISTTTRENPGKWWMGYFNAVRTNEQAKLDRPVQITLINSSDNVTIAASGSLVIDNLFSFNKKIGVTVRLTSSANFSAEVEYRESYRGILTSGGAVVIPGGTARLWDAKQVEPAGQYGSLKILNADASPITLHTVTVTLFPD